MKGHLNHLRVVFDVLRKNDIALRADKYIFTASESEYLGYIVHKYGIYQQRNVNKKKIINIPFPP